MPIKVNHCILLSLKLEIFTKMFYINTLTLVFISYMTSSAVAGNRESVTSIYLELPGNDTTGDSKTNFFFQMQI